MMNNPPKGKLEIGDTVYPTRQKCQQTQKMLEGLEGSTVLSIDGDMISLSSKDGTMKVEIHRRYFCIGEFMGHYIRDPASPCPYCGYESKDLHVDCAKCGHEIPVATGGVRIIGSGKISATCRRCGHQQDYSTNEGEYW